MTLSSLFLAAGGPFAAWFAKLHETFIVNDRYKLLIEGFRNTIILTLGALAIGLVIGTIVAVIKYLAEDAPSLRWAAFLCDVYLTVIRGVPMVVQLLIFYYIIFSHAKDGIPVAIVAFGVNSGAYMAELIRSGINAVDSGQ
ncbi:MAG: ABC transporter permease subunit, partial [Clostridia bacterium]|nr:ABC transporter permease subunit [Clostridia bacterium]